MTRVSAEDAPVVQEQELPPVAIEQDIEGGTRDKAETRSFQQEIQQEMVGSAVPTNIFAQDLPIS